MALSERTGIAFPGKPKLGIEGYPTAVTNWEMLDMDAGDSPDIAASIPKTVVVDLLLNASKGRVLSPPELKGEDIHTFLYRLQAMLL